MKPDLLHRNLFREPYGSDLGSFRSTGGGASEPTAPPVVPSLLTASINDQPMALMGYSTEPSAGRWNMANVAGGDVDGTMLAYRIKGTSAVMNCFGGDSTPYRVLVDSETFSSFTTPTLSSGKITLFTGLADTWHTVFIWTDNSPSGQGYVAPSAALIEAAEIAPMGYAYDICDPAFTGIATSPRIDNTYYPLFAKRAIARPAQSGYGTVNASIHLRAKYDSLWIFCDKSVTHVNISIGGALPTVVSLSALDGGGNTTGGWRKVNTPALTSLTEIIILGVGITTTVANGIPVPGVMAVGTGAFFTTPANTSKRHVAMLGNSQVGGVANGAGGYVNDMAMVQNRLPIFGVSTGVAGAAIATLTSAIPTLATRFPVKDIAMLSTGINNADDGTFEPAYTALIQACLDNGWTKIVCRGLVQTSSTASKNAKIASAVASFSSANVVYADVSTWTATTDGSGGSITMPDGSHPNAAGYALMADWWVRDHASLFS